MKGVSRMYTRDVVAWALITLITASQSYSRGQNGKEHKISPLIVSNSSYRVEIQQDRSGEDQPTFQVEIWTSSRRSTDTLGLEHVAKVESAKIVEDRLVLIGPSAAARADLVTIIDLQEADVLEQVFCYDPLLSPNGRRVAFINFFPRWSDPEESPRSIQVINTTGDDLSKVPVFDLVETEHDDNELGGTRFSGLSPIVWDPVGSRLYFLAITGHRMVEEEPLLWVTIDLASGLKQARVVFEPIDRWIFMRKRGLATDYVRHIRSCEWLHGESIQCFAYDAYHWRAPTVKFTPFDLRGGDRSVDPKIVPVDAIYWLPVFENDLRPSDDVYKDTEGKLRLKRDKVAADAERMAIDEKNDRYERIWGFQACEQMGIASALPAARTAVQTSTSASLKAAAVGLIGAVGGPDDVKLLESVLDGTPTARLETAVKKALSKLKKQD